MFIIICFPFKCEAVYRAMCDLEWYNWKSQQVKTIIIIMIRAQEFFYITAGKIVPLTMATFGNVTLLQNSS